MLVLRVRKKKTKQRNWSSNHAIILALTIELHFLHNHHSILVFFHFAPKLPYENRFEIDYRFETPEAKGNALQLANTLKQELFGQ